MITCIELKIIPLGLLLVNLQCLKLKKKKKLNIIVFRYSLRNIAKKKLSCLYHTLLVTPEYTIISLLDSFSYSIPLQENPPGSCLE